MRGQQAVASVVAIAREEQITVDAASLAFYAANTLVALVVLTYALFTIVGTGTALNRVLQVLTGIGAAEFQRFFDRMGGATGGRVRAVALAAVIAVWSSFRLFGAVESVFLSVYGDREERSPWRRVANSVLALVAVSLVVVGMAAAGTVFLFRTGQVVWRVLGPFVLWGALVALFGPIYYLLSGGDVSVREIAPGTAFAAAAWTVSAVGLRLYVTRSESVDLYGVVGAVLLVLTWLYVVGLAVLVGVVLNAYLADRIEADPEWYVFGT